jgi:uncharacterized protein
MPEYLRPGVYIEEQPAPQTIEGVSTSTAGFVGATQFGPITGLPQLITSFPDFTRKYGDFIPVHDEDDWGDAWEGHQYLAHAIDGFFRNGGQRAYVTRVVGPGAEPASRDLTDGFVTRLLVDTAQDQAARASARLVSVRGISVGTRVTFEETIAGNLRRQTRRVSGVRSSTGTVDFDSPLTLRYTAARCTVYIEDVDRPDRNDPDISLTVAASSPGVWGNRLRVSSVDMSGAVGLAQAAEVQAETNLRAVDLAFDDSGPDTGTTSTVLDAATISLVRTGDVIEFEFGTHQEHRTLTSVDAGTREITWGPALVHDYTDVNSRIRRLTAVRPGEVHTLEFGNDGPGAGTTETSLADVSDVQTGDIVEFWNPETGLTERRTVTDVDADEGTVQWAVDLVNSFDDEGSTVHLIRNPIMPVESTAGLTDGALLRIIGDGNSQVVRIAENGVDAGNQQVTLDAVTHPPRRSNESGDRVVLAIAGQNTSNRVDLRTTNNFYEHAAVEIDDGSIKTYHQVESIEGASLVMDAALGRDVPDGATVRVVEFSLTIDDVETNSTERYDNLSMHPESPRYFEEIINTLSRSRLVRVVPGDSTENPPFNVPRTPDGSFAVLTDGANGNPPTSADYQGVDNGPGMRTGIKALADIDGVRIIAVPGISDAAVQGELISQCEELKDRFAVIDPAVGSVIGSGEPDDVIVQRNNHDTLYAAMYYPWLQIVNPLNPEDPDGMLIPPSGHVIGIYARVDTSRGVHKAPANEVTRGITGLEVKVGDREHDILNPLNINVIRDFRESGRGIRVWGARCITSDNAWMYVPVRRMFIFLESSLFQGLQWVVFEPNGEMLWARVRRTITGFLRTLWLSGMLRGITQDEAFFVRCDRSTMTEDDIANGRLIVLVGVAPLRPAEFVIIRIGQKTIEASD